MRAEDFSYSVDVLYGVLGISKLKFLIKKDKEKFNLYFFQFLVIKTQDPGPNPDSLEMLDLVPDLDTDSLNPDPNP